MGLENCKRCGTLYVRQRTNYCADCSAWFTETYGRIREYLRMNPKRTIWDVHEELDLPLSVVQQVIKFAEQEEKK